MPYPSPAPLTVETHDMALRIARRYGYPIHDALQSSCTTLYSEDMRDGQVIEGLTIRNPFAEDNTPI
jgi:predicted nucleic acid-binding protein